MITFNGQITATTCDITWPGSGGTAKDPIVTLPTMPTTALANDGDTAGRQDVSLVIGGSDAQCTSGRAAIELNPNYDAKQSNGYLNNVATNDAATEVQVALRDANNAPDPPRQAVAFGGNRPVDHQADRLRRRIPRHGRCHRRQRQRKRRLHHRLRLIEQPSQYRSGPSGPGHPGRHARNE
ncbi:MULTISPECIES: fimbrial protein [unclassified Stenotrophomonas]|nr:MULTISPECIES: fimbrial protein [unclassified Stenotrophomonas]